MSQIKNYVISLSSAIDRRVHITNEFGKQGITFEFFDAVTYHQIDEVCATLNLPNIKATDNLANSEKGCLLSHVSLWQKMLDENIAWLAIFEDDVHLGERADLFLNHDDWLNADFGLLKIEHFYDKLCLGAATTHHHGRAIHPLHSPNLGTAGYIIHHQTAKQLLQALQSVSHHDIIAIDHFMFGDGITDGQMTTAQLSPALCIQSDRLNPNTPLQSDISHERRTRMDKEKQKRTLMQKLKREFGRIFKQVNQDKDSMQTVEFR